MTRADSDRLPPAEGAGSDLPNLPEGSLLRSRVESDLTATLDAALDRELTGYAVLEPQDALLLDADGAGVVVFEAGVPRLAYHTGTGRTGPEALTDLVAPGPYDVELRELPDPPADVLAGSDRPDLRVPPGLAADRLAGDSDLAERTRTAAPPEWHPDDETGDGARDGDDGAGNSDGGAGGGDDEPLDAVEAFLDDDEQIAEIRERAREEARERAEQWGLDGQLE